MTLRILRFEASHNARAVGLQRDGEIGVRHVPTIGGRTGELCISNRPNGHYSLNHFAESFYRRIYRQFGEFFIATENKLNRSRVAKFIATLDSIPSTGCEKVLSEGTNNNNQAAGNRFYGFSVV